MTQYLISVHHGDDYAPAADEIQQIMADVDALNGEIKSAGAWVFAGGLHPASTATVLQARDGEVLVTDGPFAEGKEHIGGFWIVEAPDLDAALEWGRKGTIACRLPVEVRPFQDEPEA
jgi:hypothetical protein